MVTRTLNNPRAGEAEAVPGQPILHNQPGLKPLAEESRQEGQIASPVALSQGHARTTCIKGSRKTTQEQGGYNKGRTLFLQKRWNQGGNH